MLHVYGGALRYYDQWFRLNVVDGEERLVVAGRGTNRHYFKFGVYAATNPSHYMESRWRDVKVYTKIYFFLSDGTQKYGACHGYRNLAALDSCKTINLLDRSN
jgi:hypothetical protein